MFTSAYGTEDTLFGLAAQLEQARPWRGRRPPVSAWALGEPMEMPRDAGG
jgi:hypothetical protein